MGKGEHQAGQVAGVVGGLYALHSLMAWSGTKALARRIFGARYDPGLYRFFYTVKSFATALLGLVWFLRQPDRELYRLRWPWSLLGRAVQLAGIAVLLDVVRVVGPFRMLGVRQAVAALLGREPPATPVAQGPPLAADGTMDARGLFRRIRHPDNLPAVLLFFGFPRMTYNRLALAVTTLVYAVLGSLHEDARLRAAYGEAFARYERAVPLMVPRPGRRAPEAATALAESVASPPPAAMSARRRRPTDGP
ncbi:MAG TPA: hypothetical protein PKD53_24830 [Chloroflexaceae bacterium]|nr:hypothetical protein [Chloroflexaceae bacterium]